MSQDQGKKHQFPKSFNFSIENIRCFENKQELKIRPLTFLVGENSTGKTTALACLNALNSMLKDDIQTPFNIEPYDMAYFEDIIRQQTKKLQPNFALVLENEFCIQTFKFKEDKQKLPIISNTVIQIHHKTQNNKKIEINFETGILDIKFSFFWEPNDNKKQFFQCKIYEDQDKTYAQLFLDENKDRNIQATKKTLAVNLNQDLTSNTANIDRLIRILVSIFNKNSNEKATHIQKALDFLMLTLAICRDNYHMSCGHYISLGPVRAKPERAYDKLKELSKPKAEGGGAPLKIIDLWTTLYEKLKQFGKLSGLFTDIEVKKPDVPSDPFKLFFEVRGTKSNIKNIGYGVSQILPILTNIYHKEMEIQRFLLQQPEVHLHPKAQAELSSLLIDNTKNTNNAFIIETHSDYMVDRASIEIRKKNISPDDVSLIYFHPVEDRVEVHNLSFDENGNLENAPDGYRDFFLKESDSFLGLD